MNSRPPLLMLPVDWPHPPRDFHHQCVSLPMVPGPQLRTKQQCSLRVLSVSNLGRSSREQQAADGNILRVSILRTVVPKRTRSRGRGEGRLGGASGERDTNGAVWESSTSWVMHPRCRSSLIGRGRWWRCCRPRRRVGGSDLHELHYLHQVVHTYPLLRVALSENDELIHLLWHEQLDPPLRLEGRDELREDSEGCRTRLAIAAGRRGGGDGVEYLCELIGEVEHGPAVLWRGRQACCGADWNEMALTGVPGSNA